MTTLKWVLFAIVVFAIVEMQILEINCEFVLLLYSLKICEKNGVGKCSDSVFNIVNM